MRVRHGVHMGKWSLFENLQRLEECQAIQKTIESCKQSGNNPEHHFADARKPILGGKGAVQVVDDY